MRPSRLEDSRLTGYYYLRADDRCYYMREYTPRGGYGASATNQLIKNLKKGLETRGTPQWPWKGRAIRQVAGELSTALSGLNPGYTFVPIPGSKGKLDDGHDNRLVQILRAVRIDGNPIDARELVVQEISVPAAHLSEGKRPSPAELIGIWSIDETLAAPAPDRFVVFDDVLTSGSHFRAMNQMLGERFSPQEIIGLFVARTLHDPDDATV